MPSSEKGLLLWGQLAGQKNQERIAAEHHGWQRDPRYELENEQVSHISPRKD
jgi:hypothetical protein